MDLELSSLPALERYKLLIGLVIPRPIEEHPAHREFVVNLADE